MHWRRVQNVLGIYLGVDRKRNGGGVILEAYAKNVGKVKRVSDKVVSVKLEFEGVMINVVTGYSRKVCCAMEVR